MCTFYSNNKEIHIVRCIKITNIHPSYMIRFRKHTTEQIVLAESELISDAPYNVISGHGQYGFLTKFEYFPVFNYSLLNKGLEAERALSWLLAESIRNCYLWMLPASRCTVFVNNSFFVERETQASDSETCYISNVVSHVGLGESIRCAVLVYQ